MRWADCEDDEGRMEHVMLELAGLEMDEGEKGTERDEGRAEGTERERQQEAERKKEQETDRGRQDEASKRKKEQGKRS